MDDSLTCRELSVRHDFTLLLLLRAWQAPWTPETHASFQPQFRAAVETVAKATHKLGLPHSRKQCWCYACLVEKSTNSIAQKMSPEYPSANDTSVTGPLEYCPHCKVAMYCSKACRNNDYYIGHKARCGRPPMISNHPLSKELLLYSKILTNDGEDTSLPSFLLPYIGRMKAIEEDVNDRSSCSDGSWETVSNSDDDNASNENTISKTERISMFFRDWN
jgi:MYND finger